MWGSTFLVISIGNDTVPPFWAAALRLALAVPLLGIIAVATRQRLPRGAQLRAAVGYGIFSHGISLSMLYWAEKEVPSALAAILYATLPLTSAILTHVFGLERITLAKIVAAVIALAGVAVIFSDQLQGGVAGLPLTVALVSSVSASIGTILLKRGGHQPPVASNAVGATVGFVFCFLVSMIAGEAHSLPRTFPELFPIVYLTLAGSVGAYVLLSWLVNYWDVTKITYISVIVPIVALVLGTLVRHERISGNALFGSLLVLAGVLLRIRADRHPPPLQKPA